MVEDVATKEGRETWRRRLQTKRINSEDERERVAFLQALELLDHALPVARAADVGDPFDDDDDHGGSGHAFDREDFARGT